MERFYFVLIGLLSALVLISVFCGIGIGFVFGLYDGTPKVYSENCTNLSLVDSSYCLNQQVNTFFKYNLLNKGKTLTDEELKESGGTCLLWANYYVNNMKDLGFLGQIVSMQQGNQSLSGHSIALVWSERNDSIENFCIIDQKKVIGCG